LAFHAAQALLSGTDTQFAEARTIDTDWGHGRTERRTVRVAPADDSLLPGTRQVLRLRRDTGGLDPQRTGKDIVYGITSLPAELASPPTSTTARASTGAWKTVYIGPAM
jgi:hypothetical protein